MAAAERVQLQAASPPPLSLRRQRELAALVDRYHDRPDDAGDDLAVAVARWAFECGDVACLPAHDELRRLGLLLLPLTPWGDVAAVYIAAPAPAPVVHVGYTPSPSLRSLGAQPIDAGKRG